MKSLFYLSLGLISVALLSCSHREQAVPVRYSATFVKDTSVALTSVPLPMNIEYVVDMKYLKNRMILRSGISDAKYKFHVFHLPQMELEALLPKDERIGYLEYGQKALLSYKLASDSIYKVDWRANTLHAEGIGVSPRRPDISMIAQQDEHTLLCNMPLSKGNLREIYRYDFRTGSASSFGTYPEDNTRFKSMRRYQEAYHHGIAVKPDGTKLLSYYLSLRRFRIYDIGGELLQDVSIDYAPFEYVVHASHNKYFYIGGAWVTDNRIYLLCVDRDMSVEDPPGEASLVVTDWEGNLLTRYRMDHYITFFFIDEQETTFYGINPWNGQRVFRFQL